MRKTQPPVKKLLTVIRKYLKIKGKTNNPKNLEAIEKFFLDNGIDCTQSFHACLKELYTVSCAKNIFEFEHFVEVLVTFPDE